MVKESLRTDALTREKLPISELLRFAKVDGYLVLSKTYESKGKGIYLKKDPSTIELLKNPKSLKRLGAKIDLETIKELEASL